MQIVPATSRAPMPALMLWAVPNLPMVQAGDFLPSLIHHHARSAGFEFLDGDVLVLAQKIVSKAEGRRIDLCNVRPSPRALELSARVDKDPRLVELILSESKRIVRAARGVLIVEHRLGYIAANAGIDQSNVADPATGEYAMLLPADPDASAAHIRRQMFQLCSKDIGVVISDSFGRPWRLGSVGIALGSAGIASLNDIRGEPDLFGRQLRVSIVAHADEVAAAASLLMGQGNEGRPAILVRGLPVHTRDIPALALLRNADEDLFR